MYQKKVILVVTLDKDGTMAEFPDQQRYYRVILVRLCSMASELIGFGLDDRGQCMVMILDKSSNVLQGGICYSLVKDYPCRPSMCDETIPNATTYALSSEDLRGLCRTAYSRMALLAAL